MCIRDRCRPDLEFSRLESWSRDPFLQVLVSVSVLNLGVLVSVLGLETVEQMNLRSVVMEHLEYVTTARTPNSDPWVEVARSDTYKVLHPLLEKVFCLPATTAPVGRIFSHSGLLMRANRARMRDNMLSQLVYLRYNNKL